MYYTVSTINCRSALHLAESHVVSALVHDVVSYCINRRSPVDICSLDT